MRRCNFTIANRLQRQKYLPDIRVHVDVTGVKMALDDQFVLLRVTSTDHQVVLRADEPEELLEPYRLAMLDHIRAHFHLK
jgi:hypothetical protein